MKRTHGFRERIEVFRPLNGSLRKKFGDTVDLDVD